MLIKVAISHAATSSVSAKLLAWSLSTCLSLPCRTALESFSKQKTFVENMPFQQSSLSKRVSNVHSCWCKNPRGMSKQESTLVVNSLLCCIYSYYLLQDCSRGSIPSTGDAASTSERSVKNYKVMFPCTEHPCMPMSADCLHRCNDQSGSTAQQRMVSALHMQSTTSSVAFMSCENISDMVCCPCMFMSINVAAHVGSCNAGSTIGSHQF